jgi:hypothetical protein
MNRPQWTWTTTIMTCTTTIISTFAGEKSLSDGRYQSWFKVKLPVPVRRLLEPLFTELFLGPGQVLSLFCGKYSQGSYVTSHTDDQVVTLDGQDRYRRKRAFLLYLNEVCQLFRMRFAASSALYHSMYH